MPAIKSREIRRMCESHGPEKVAKHIGTNLREGKLRPEDFSIRD
ncbi:hypothetical protein LCGC14_0754410, partial [marine sediment metagenome]